MKRIAMALATCALALGLTPVMAQEALALSTGDLVICGTDATSLDTDYLDDSLEKKGIASVIGGAWLEAPSSDNGNMYTLHLEDFSSASIAKQSFIVCSLPNFGIKVSGNCELKGSGAHLSSAAVNMTYGGDATLVISAEGSKATNTLFLSGTSCGIRGGDGTALKVATSVDELTCVSTGPAGGFVRTGTYLPGAGSKLAVEDGSFESFAEEGTALNKAPQIAGSAWYGDSKAEALSIGERNQATVDADTTLTSAKYFRAGKFDISDMTLAFTKKTVTYNGTMKLPTFELDGLWPNGMTYGVLVKSGSASGVGNHTVALVGKGNYVGTTTADTYTTNPLGTKLLSVKAGKKAFTAKWDKQAMQTDGYQIRYSTKSSMASAKTVTVGKKTTVSKTVKSLKAKKTYYMQVRTYKTIDGKKLVSSWSSKKKVKTK